MKSEFKFFGMGIIVMILVSIIVLSICGIFGIFLWPYTLNTWLTFAGKEASVVWWHGAILGFIPPTCVIQFPLTIITWIAMLFLV